MDYNRNVLLNRFKNVYLSEKTRRKILARVESARRMEAERGGILTKSSGTKQASGKPNRGGVSQVSPMVLRFGADSSSGRREINSNKYQTNNPTIRSELPMRIFLYSNLKKRLTI